MNYLVGFLVGVVVSAIAGYIWSMYEAYQMWKDS